MLRHAHFYMNGGEPSFAARCAKVCNADKADLCTCGYCWRSIVLLLWHADRCRAAKVTEPDFQQR